MTPERVNDDSFRRHGSPEEGLEAIQDQLCQGVSVQTSNYYLSHLKSFCRWLVKNRRMPSHPFEHLSGGNIDTDHRHDHRELTAEELRWLLAVTRGSNRHGRPFRKTDRSQDRKGSACVGYCRKREREDSRV